MKQQDTKNNGCVVIIGLLLILFVALFLIMKVTDIIGVVLSYPIVYFGIPIFFLIILYIKSKNHDSKK